MECHEREETEVHWFGGCCVWIFADPSRCGLQTIPGLEEVPRKFILGERLAIDLDAFTDKAEMRRGV